MKQFLYLDTDIVNSIIAQSEKGLVQTLSNENENSTAKDTHVESAIEGTGSGEGAFFKFVKAGANLSLSGELARNFSSENASREIISKVLHDAAFDIAYDYIKPKHLQVEDDNDDDCGKYVELTRTFDFVDMDYIENLFSKNGLIDLLKKTSKEKIETEAGKVTNGMNREQFRANGKTVKNDIKKMVADSDKQYDDIHDTVVAFHQLMPYTRMLISSDGYLIPLDDKYFRVSPESLGFRYGGEITCVGMITNIIGADTKPGDSQNVFATLRFYINEVLRSILPTSKDNLCVLHPIAVFYGR